MIAVVGGGAWGTALANAMAQADDVLLWAREAEVVDAVNGSQRNPLFLPGIELSPRVRASADIADLAGIDLWLVVPPAQFLGRVLQSAPLAHRHTHHHPWGILLPARLAQSGE